MQRQSLNGSELKRTGVVAVLRAPSVEAYLPVIETLASAGITCVELTLTTPHTIEKFPWLRSQFSDALEIGIGTVTNTDLAAAAIDAGARFLVTPVTRPSIVELAAERLIPIYPGSMTPSEVLANWEAGATAVKVFPAATVGADYFRQLRGPFPDIALLPSGGVNLDDIPMWIAAGSVAVSLGGPLVGGAFGDEDPSKLRSRAARALDLVANARVA